MKYKAAIGLILAIVSNSTLAQMTLEDVNRNLEVFNDPAPSQQEMDRQWSLYNKPARSTDNGQPDRHWYDHPFSNGRTYHNNYGHEIVISARGGSRLSDGRDESNRCHIQIVVDGQLLVDTRDNNHNLAKSCFASANIPKGASYRISSNPWQTWGKYRTTVKVFR
ncbi:hypothetical protein ACPV3S_15840 [Photobacterium damselae]|uniref:hypothetical protein n=1 Tax=Photobacterium damselae TaxID=38293 RepID=UPI004068DF51